ncbi:MAG TPA: DUF552 domain-containing protein [Nautiliaceae bacterium]|nr:DUF552 domain-containing protein [Nautiliaceae bacterium]
MVSFLKRFIKEKEKKEGALEDLEMEEFIEIDVSEKRRPDVYYRVKAMVINEYLDLKPVLKHIRDGSYIILVNLKPLKMRDSVELKRVVEKIKQAIESLEGDLIGFGKGEWLLITPPGIIIEREKDEEEKEIEEKE